MITLKNILQNILLVGTMISLILCIGYGLVYQPKKYMIFWLAISIVMGMGWKTFAHMTDEFISKYPTTVRMFEGMIVVGICIFIFVEGCIIYYGNYKQYEPSDYVLVLGAGLRGREPSLSLQYRLNEAITYNQKFPDVPIIVSGGQGPGEDITEAEAMEYYLIRAGIPKHLIIEENQSTSTEENLQFTKVLMSQQGINIEEKKITLISNDFHIFRAKILAEKEKLQVYLLAGQSVSYLRPTYFIREFFGVIKVIGSKMINY